MKPTITDILYDWMLDKRIITDVAREMGMGSCRLSGELRPGQHKSKLGADELVPIFEALRRLGYGAEARGLLTSFVRDLRGDRTDEIYELIPQLLRMHQLTSELSNFARSMEAISDETELGRMERLLRTELMPLVLGIQGYVTQQRRMLREAKQKLEWARENSNGKIGTVAEFVSTNVSEV